MWCGVGGIGSHIRHRNFPRHSNLRLNMRSQLCFKPVFTWICLHLLNGKFNPSQIPSKWSKGEFEVSTCALGSCSLNSPRHSAFSFSPADGLGRDEPCHRLLQKRPLCCQLSQRYKRNQPPCRPLSVVLVFCDLGLNEGAGPRPLLSGQV